ncbi:ribbon-helix-helix protein, CopG family [Leptospira ilyithenensis]|uniref:Ribbon-helix-helix protein, CopG family n=1 Tax=Leptospira ilyithenensis TaxID=2484901 RepID=A0A4R9LQ91_9LEPT|nr:ribbon-helix-helix protein, CopG family [Leptospira ilyithenensis]TGN08361.1 ribbon-helix-helix protein, CopG family [Leptospira ilyithenensis]
MRTILEIPEEKISILDEISKEENVSRAELIRKAIDHYLLDFPRIRREASFGIWKSQNLDSLQYERSIRDEWTS